MIRRAYLAEFADEEGLKAAARALREKGYTRLDAFTPHAVKDLDLDLGLPRSKLALGIFPLAALAAAAGFAIQWYTNASSYPVDVGGRPLFAWPAWIPITFESAILATGVLAFVLFLALERYPEPWSPIFDVEGFERASIDRFWLALDASDPRFDAGRSAGDLASTGPLRLAGLGMEVP